MVLITFYLQYRPEIHENILYSHHVGLGGGGVAARGRHRQVVGEICLVAQIGGLRAPVVVGCLFGHVSPLGLDGPGYE